MEVGLAAGEHQLEPVGRHSGVAIGGEVGAGEAQAGELMSFTAAGAQGDCDVKAH